ncbi:MAG TPA: hypothetical protein VE570_01045, partial [Thermoleophilaceae bacterium]|nr:hypothetical protein [Thermoleophilaceae bacterium]
ARNPVTLLALKDVRNTFQVLRPLAEFVAPYNTVCNNGVAFFTGLAGHMSEEVTGGTSEVVLMKTGSNFQEHAFNQNESERPADVPSNVDPQTYVDPAGDHYQVFHNAAVSPAVDAQGNADCQTGQTGYVDGPVVQGGSKYAPASLADPANPLSFKTWESTSGGGSHVTPDSDLPGLAGPSFVGKRLGIDRLSDVP